tara:strand:- start:173 stop:1123 length:951 start_codon:yes stop_codon:yes gene_type:complete
MNRARPINEVLKDEKTSPRIRNFLKEVPRIKQASEDFGLKPTSNYRDYVQLDRDSANYVVSASEPLRFKPMIWSFPIVGSFSYLGWFSLEDAKSFAEDIKKDFPEWDVSIRGAGAYSTLGWFTDPILSTMFSQGEYAMGDLVNVVFHESVHATLYMNDQSYFNESIASFAADHMTPQYLSRRYGQDSKEFTSYQKQQKKRQMIKNQLYEAYRSLEALYSSSKNDEEKKEEKLNILEQLKNKLKSKKSYNNASLIQYRTYGVGMDSFEKLFDTCQKKWKNFWRAMHSLKESSFEKKQMEDFKSVIHPYIMNGCQKIK